MDEQITADGLTAKRRASKIGRTADGRKQGTASREKKTGNDLTADRKTKFMDLLRKLGIVRWGSQKAVYHNAKERPIENQQEGVFNSEHDLIYSDEKKRKK